VGTRRRGGFSTHAWFVLTQLLGYRDVREYDRSRLKRATSQGCLAQKSDGMMRPRRRPGRRDCERRMSRFQARGATESRENCCAPESDQHCPMRRLSGDQRLIGRNRPLTQ